MSDKLILQEFCTSWRNNKINQSIFNLIGLIWNSSFLKVDCRGKRKIERKNLMKLLSMSFIIFPQSPGPFSWKQIKSACFFHVSSHSSNTVISKAILYIVEILKCIKSKQLTWIKQSTYKNPNIQHPKSRNIYLYLELDLSICLFFFINEVLFGSLDTVRKHCIRIRAQCILPNKNTFHCKCSTDLKKNASRTLLKKVRENF